MVKFSLRVQVIEMNENWIKVNVKSLWREKGMLGVTSQCLAALLGTMPDKWDWELAAWGCQCIKGHELERERFQGLGEWWWTIVITICGLEIHDYMLIRWLREGELNPLTSHVIADVNWLIAQLVTPTSFNHFDFVLQHAQWDSDYRVEHVTKLQWLEKKEKI